MLNLQEFILGNDMFRRFEVDELLFIEFQCPMEEGDLGMWWHNNFFAFVLRGETIIRTARDTYTLYPGDCVFSKKGSVITRTQQHNDFCELLVFVPDSFIKTIVEKYPGLMADGVQDSESDTVIRLPSNDLLKNYFNSLYLLFRQETLPNKVLLKLKFEELLLNILSDPQYAQVKSYFAAVSASNKPDIRAIMEANFTQQLTLAEYARLCARSLSGFKKEFKATFKTTPGKWLLNRRLDYARQLLRASDRTIEEVSFDAGFKNRSHFIRVFRERYNQTPGAFRRSR